jgi:polysaccharide biosynthesis/export protein
MFRVSDETKLGKQVTEAEKNYVISKNDQLELQVFTNKGERILDPDFELSKDISTSSIASKQVQTYLIDIKGVVKFPLIGEINLEGLTIRQAEEILQKEYLCHSQICKQKSRCAWGSRRYGNSSGE